MKVHHPMKKSNEATARSRVRTENRILKLRREIASLPPVAFATSGATLRRAG